MTGFTDITVEAARILGEDRSETDLSLDGLTTLSAESAEGLAACRGPLSLDGLRTIEPAVEDVLIRRARRGTYCQVTSLQGLEVLASPAVAGILAEYAEYRGDALFFSRLRTLSPAAAKVLSATDCGLGFSGYARLDPMVKSILCEGAQTLQLCGLRHLTLKKVLGLGRGGKTHEGELRLPDACQLDTDAATELAKYPGSEIHLPALKSISPEVAEAFASYSGDLYFFGVSKHTPEVAIALAKRSGRTHSAYSHVFEAEDGNLIVRLNEDSVFNLGQVRKLTPELAATLAEAPLLDLRNLKKLTPEAAGVLARNHHGSLLLDGLESLSDRVAAALSLHDGGVSLRRLQRISLTAARYLTDVRGFLSLGGLKTLTPRLAAVLAECPGNLMLDGVTELTPGVARKLRKHTGILSMNGVTAISEETAKILAGKPNQKRMVRCGGSVAAVQHLLKNDAERVTMMFRLNEDGAFA